MGISLHVPEGGVVAVLGANGSGKSTLLRAISGLARDAKGVIEFGGKSILRTDSDSRKEHFLEADEVVRLGVLHVPEGRQIFSDMTVLDNLKLGAYTRVVQNEIRKNLDRVLELFQPLRDKRMTVAGNLSGGEQQMLSIARALMGEPRLLLLDEPSMGLAPSIVGGVFEIILRINRERGCSVLLVEQNAVAALEIAQYAYVLEAPGQVALEGPSIKLRSDESVRKAYLGA